MLPFNPLKSVREQNISVAEWSSRVDPGVGEAQLRPMKPVSGRHNSVVRSGTSAPRPTHSSTDRVTERYDVADADENFAKWIRDIGAPDQGTPFKPAMASQELEHNEPASVESTTPSQPVPVVNEAVYSAVVPSKEVVDHTFHSVNSAEHRLDTAYFHLRTMDLSSEASWPQIMARYQELMVTLKAGPRTLPAEAAKIARQRRSINTAYACLRLLAGKQN